MLLVALAVAVLAGAVLAGSVAAARLQTNLIAMRVGVVSWIGCVTMLPIAVVITPSWCERTGGIEATEIAVIVGVVLLAASCGFLSRLLVRQWTWSLALAAFATIGSYFTVWGIMNVMPGIPSHCPAIS